MESIKEFPRGILDQVISSESGTPPNERAPGPGQQLGEVQPWDRETTPSSKPQASSFRRQASSFKPQAQFRMILRIILRKYYLT